MAPKIDPRLLKGLKFRSSEGKEEKTDGRTRLKYYPTERDVTPDDVLSIKDYGDKVVLVIADGKKYSIPSGPEALRAGVPKKDEDEKKEQKK